LHAIIQGCDACMLSNLVYNIYFQEKIFVNNN
jgi:hypothetical protein